MTSCVIVDDHEEVLDSVAAYLESEGVEVVGRARTAADAVRILGAVRPDVLVVDYRLPDATGIEVANALAVASPRTRTVLFSGQATRAVVSEALASGIRAVVLKESPPATLLRAVRTVLRGRRYVDPHLRSAR